MTAFGLIAFGCLIICTTSGSDITNERRPSPNLTSYIFLGQDVSNSVPYIVSIQSRTNTRKWRHLCAGSIISSNYILTAAHCLVPDSYDDGVKQFRIRAGSSSLKSRIGSSHKIVSKTSHPLYLNEFSGYDIGVVKVHPRFKFNQKTIAKIKFESSQTVADDIPVVFHGWGYTHFGRTDRLQEAYFKTLSEETCEMEGGYNVASTDFCVTSEDSSFPHVGDSGGPLVNEEKNLQLGICSYGSFKINFNYSYPTVFTRVPEFSNWIKNEIRK